MKQSLALGAAPQRRDAMPPITDGRFIRLLIAISAIATPVNLLSFRLPVPSWESILTISKINMPISQSLYLDFLKTPQWKVFRFACLKRDGFKCTNNIETRREMRPTRCRVEFKPKDGNKEFFNCVTGKLEKVEAMTPSDYNLDLFDKEEVKKEAPLNPVLPESRQISATSEGHQVIDAEIILPPHEPESK